MAEVDDNKNNVYSENDTLDINELASLNQDISADFIEELQSKVSQSATKLTGKADTNNTDDSELFEEVNQNASENPVAKAARNITIDDSIDDNFVRKYRAKLNKQKMLSEEQLAEENAKAAEEQPAPVVEEQVAPEPEPEPEPEPVVEAVPETKTEPEPQVSEPEVQQTEEKAEETSAQVDDKDKPIENLTSGKIIEKPVNEQDISYNESLNLLDNNTKYSKYVIYIDPENTEFIESLTVKERKNLINRIIREQDDIAITKRRLGMVQTFIRHAIIAALTIIIAVPIFYIFLNASLEATINNHTKSQSNFQTLYKEHGKIKSNF